jgi:hypothetical protein
LGMQVNGSEMNGMINNPYFLNNHT